MTSRKQGAKRAASHSHTTLTLLTLLTVPLYYFIVNVSEAETRQFNDSAREQSHRISVMYHYSPAEEEALRKQILAKYIQAKTPKIVPAPKQVPVKSGFRKVKVTKAKSVFENAARGLSTSAGVKVPKVSKSKMAIKKIINYGGRQYRYIVKTDDIRKASQKCYQLKEAEKILKVKNIVTSKGKEYLIVYAASAKRKATTA
jgi:hypothetical protein